jgi:hypothetical protein
MAFSFPHDKVPPMYGRVVEGKQILHLHIFMHEITLGKQIKNQNKQNYYFFPFQLFKTLNSLLHNIF